MNLKLGTSDNPDATDAYRRSARAKRRAAQRRNRAAVNLIPNVMGPPTRIYAALAVHGTLRRADPAHVFREEILATLHKTDRLGLTVEWTLPGYRGIAVALDPRFPLLSETRSVLVALADGVDFGVETTATQAESSVPRWAKRRGSTNRPHR